MRTLVIGAVPYSYDGSSYYRLWLPFKNLTERSHHITGVLPPGQGQTVNPAEADSFDVLVLQRPCGKEGTRLLERLAGRTRLVYEVDDDMLEVDPAGLPHLYDENIRESVRRCLRLVDMVTVSSAHLAEVYAPFNDNIVVLPNHVKAGLLEVQRRRSGRVTVGWAGGTSHLIDMVEIAGVLGDMLTLNPDVDVHFVGFDFSPLLGGLRGRCRQSGWQKDVGDYYKRIDFDIAIAPSADVPFNRSKTPLRALEMGALGIPIVASNRLPYSDFVIDGKTGFLVNTPGEWRARLDDLIHDEAMRTEMGAAGKEQAAGWTIEEGWRLWEAAYEKAAGD